MARRPRVFAEGTGISVEETRQQIEQLLHKRGATRIFYMAEPDAIVAGFVLDGLVVRFTVPVEADKQRPQRMRALLLLIKARFASIDAGITTFEREFLANVVMPDGNTAAEWPDLRKRIAAGKMPLLLEGQR